MSDDDTMKMLDAAFADLRAAPQPASDDLMARMLADAQGETERRQNARAGAEPGLLARLFAGIGGWRGASGLLAASLTGVWIGVSVPALSGADTAMEDTTLAESFAFGSTDAFTLALLEEAD